MNTKIKETIDSKFDFKPGKGRFIGKPYKTSAADLKNELVNYFIVMGSDELASTALAESAEIMKFFDEKMAPEQGDDKKEKFIFNTEKLTEWLDYHKESWKVSIDGKTITRYLNGIPMEQDVDVLGTAINVSLLDSGISCSKDSIMSVIKNYCNDASMNGLYNLVKSLSYDESKCVKTEGYLAAVHKFFGIKQDFSIFSTAMKHWAWQVKRKMKGLPVRNHLWVSLQGGAGLGKSTLVQRLTKPFGGFSVATTLGKVLDSTKEIKLLSSSYILNMDEIAVNSERTTDGDHALTKDQMNVLKSVLTGDYINARVYGTQEQARRRITFSVISTSNDHLYDIIYDEATMRRYIEFNCTAPRPTEFNMFERLTSDAEGFWQGIDETLDDGYLLTGSAEYNAIDALQKSYFPTNKTTWLWAKHLANDEVIPGSGFMSMFRIGEEHPMNSLYENYKNYCKDYDVQMSSRPRFESFIKHFVKAYDGDGNLKEKSAAFDHWIQTIKDVKLDTPTPEMPIEYHNEKEEDEICEENYLPF